MTPPHIALSDPTLAEARGLIAALDHYLNGLYAVTENHLLDPEQLKAPDIRFVLARLADGTAVGCGALRLDDSGYAEIKRMYVDPAHRGHGIAGAILSSLADIATTAGITLLKLETGNRQHEALALYHRLGFTPCRAFGDYPCAAGASLYMEKRL